MITSLTLALACAAQGTGHAAHHPRAAAFFVECPDVAAALTAYEQAPAARMLRDAAVGEVLEKVSKALGIDRSQLTSSVLAPLGIPDDEGADPFGLVLEAARSATSFSLSFSMSEAEPGELRRSLDALNSSLAALDRIAEALEQHSREHSSLPSDLASLQLPADLSRDPWGRPFEYRVLDGGAFQVSTLGRDGAVGGAGVDADVSHETDIDPLAIAELERRFAVCALVRFATEDGARRAVEWLGGRLTLVADENAQPKGWERQRLQLDAPDNVAWLARSQALVALGFGAVSTEQLAARVAGAQPGLDLAEAWRKLEAHSGPRRGAVILRGWGDSDAVARIVPNEGPLGGGALASVFQELSGGSGTWRMQLDAGRFTTDMSLNTAAADSWLGLLGAEPAPREAFDYVPSDAVGFFAAQLDAAALRARVAKLLTSAADGSEAGALQELQTKHGFDLQQDICANLRGGLSAYLLPISGIGLPNVGLVAAVRDPAAFERGARGLFKALSEAQADKLSVRESKYRDAPMWTVNFAAEGADPQLAAFLPTPTLSIVKDRLIVSLTSLRAKKEIKRALGEDDGPHPVASDSSRLPAPGGFTGWMDWAATIDGFYGMARSAAAMFGAQLDLPIDLPGLMTALPESSRVFTKFFEPTTLTVRSVDDGFVMRWDSSFGPEVWLGMVGLVAGVTQSSRLPSPANSDEEPGAQPPDERREQALATLSALSTRITVFRLDQGRLPASLDELAKATPNYPRGFLEGLDIAADPWGASYAYELNSSGEAFRLWSKGPDGVDAAGEGDDVLAP